MTCFQGWASNTARTAAQRAPTGRSERMILDIQLSANPQGCACLRGPRRSFTCGKWSLFILTPRWVERKHSKPLPSTLSRGDFSLFVLAPFGQIRRLKKKKKRGGNTMADRQSFFEKETKEETSDKRRRGVWGICRMRGPGERKSHGTESPLG